jgi:hypothetical protein
MSLFLKMLRLFKNPTIQCHLLSVTSLLLRYATYITLDLSNNGIILLLTDLLKDSALLVKRRAICALGELLFYIATQDTLLKTDEISSWRVSTLTLKLIIKCVKHEDEIIRHYAVKTIENVTNKQIKYYISITYIQEKYVSNS